MVRGCSLIDSRLDTAKIYSDGRVHVDHAQLPAVFGEKKRFHTAWTQGGHRAGGRTAHRCDRIFLRRELYIKGGFWQASAERRLAEDWRRMSPRAMAAHVLGRERAAP